tara:strand:- start:203 stop:496 length:294 start_codon:yes stop_codon:yes gene_type:complete
MKKIFIIITLVLISCGNSSPSACDCAEMSKERIESKMETLTKSSEEQQEIVKSWEEKLAPCAKKIEESMPFEKEVQDCLISLFQLDNNEVLEDSSPD